MLDSLPPPRKIAGQVVLAIVFATAGALGTGLGSSLLGFDIATQGELDRVEAKADSAIKQSSAIPEMRSEMTRCIETMGLETRDRAALQASYEATVSVGIDPRRRKETERAAGDASMWVLLKWDEYCCVKMTAREAAERAVRFSRTQR